jgi:hypothetical protein
MHLCARGKRPQQAAVVARRLMHLSLTTPGRDSCLRKSRAEEVDKCPSISAATRLVSALLLQCLAGCVVLPRSLSKGQDDMKPPIAAPRAMRQVSALAARTNRTNYKLVYSFDGPSEGRNPVAMATRVFVAIPNAVAAGTKPRS